MRSENRKANRYEVNGVDLSRIKNRNERRVIAQMKPLLAENGDYEPDILAIQDIYALALNLLPARYTQQFTIVLQDPVDEAAIEKAVRKAIDKVRANPTEKAEYKSGGEK